MTRPPGSGVQRAIGFLSKPDLATRLRAPLPDRPDYEFLAQHASPDDDLSPSTVKEAFRLIMLARRVARGHLAGAEADDR